MNKNYYDILGIENTASIEDIKTAYRKLSLLYHPDKNDNDNSKLLQFKSLTEAYETLSDNILRDKYNRYNNIINYEKNNYCKNNNYHENNNYENNNYENKKSQLVNAQHSYIDSSFLNNLHNNNLHNNNLHNNNLHNNNLHNNNLHNNNLHNNNLDNNNNNNNNNNFYFNNPKSIELIKEIDYNQSYYGDTIPILIERYIIFNNEKYTETETIYIDIDSGIDNNEIIIIKNKGNIINNVYGDVKIKILLLDNSLFKRNGLDIIYIKNITFKESICGFTFQLKHINDKIYTINNNTGIIINPNYTTNIPKLGFKKNNNIGNLIIKYNISYPDKLNSNIINKLNDIL